MAGLMRKAVSESTFQLFGVAVKCYVLDDGTRVIDRHSLQAVMNAMANGAPLDMEDLRKFSKWQQGDDSTTPDSEWVVIVCGGRDYNDREEVFNTLDQLLEACYLKSTNPHLTIVEGGATGADTLAGEWAAQQIDEGANVKLVTVAADWGTHGRAAGPIRNRKMLDEHSPHLIIAFPGGNGTRNMVKQAQEAGIIVKVIT